MVRAGSGGRNDRKIVERFLVECGQYEREFMGVHKVCSVIYRSGVKLLCCYEVRI